MSRSLCCLAFESLYTKLNPVINPIAVNEYAAILNESFDDFPIKAPLFVTWNKNSNLRGCIGTFSSQELINGIKRFSLSASLKDPRFPPVRQSEFKDLEVSITLLDSFTPITNSTDWTIGTHGLKLEINHDGEFYSGTFLPVVAEEQNWDQETTLYYLLKKADFKMPINEEITDFYNRGISEGWLNLEKYNGIKMGMSFGEFNEIRNKVK